MHQPVLLVVLFDNSPSVGGRNDAMGHRFAEAAAALSEWQGRCSCEQRLVAVRTFTTDFGGPVSVGGPEWPPLLRAVADVEDTTSRLRPALVATERLAHAHAGHRPVLVVLSDFELLDDVPGLVLRRLRRFPGHVHAIVLNDEPPRQLVTGRVGVSRATPERQPGDVAHAIVAAITAVEEDR